MPPEKERKDTGANLGFEAKLWAAAENDGEPFEAKMKRLVSQLHEQQEAAKLDAANLKELGDG